MNVNLDVLQPDEWRPNPGRARLALSTVAVYCEQVGGFVWARGYVCAIGEPDCGGGWRWEGQVLVSAIRAHLDGSR